MNKKLSLLLFSMLAFLTSSGQDKQGKDTGGQIQQISREQYNSISKEIKTFKYNPTYQVRFTAQFCTYEIYINDMLANFSFTTGNSAGEQHADIPQYILQSGPQEIKIKIYPKAIQDGKLEDKLRQEAAFSARIVHGEYGKTDWDSFTQVAALKVPIKGGENAIEYKTSFNAQVPYQSEGWKNGIDLSKEQKTDLIKEALSINQQFARAYRYKDIERIASMIYNREKEVTQSFFFRSGEPKSYDDGWEKIQKEADEIQKIKISVQYDLRYFGNGKVVALLQHQGEDRDFPVIEAETNEDYIYYALYLYRPKAGAPLKIIR
ncbi:hypothetical protein ABIE26_004247 [Pedobacter africanus]|uniref:Uncharacterized protein n=1 Tax=Pedobacter africanus TaxID=151894 RepID=A0ACC6L271_9SPHI|nr:hypothetical protein [Pedobacter africanus]MDR6785537.1 hypothetical protein [Pedobacter africanus]